MVCLVAGERTVRLETQNKIGVRRQLERIKHDRAVMKCFLCRQFLNLSVSFPSHPSACPKSSNFKDGYHVYTCCLEIITIYTEIIIPSMAQFHI